MKPRDSVVERIKPLLPTFHTRAMHKALYTKFDRVSIGVKPSKSYKVSSSIIIVYILKYAIVGKLIYEDKSYIIYVHSFILYVLYVL